MEHDYNIKKHVQNEKQKLTVAGTWEFMIVTMTAKKC